MTGDSAVTSIRDRFGLVPSTRNPPKLVQPSLRIVIKCAMLKIIGGLATFISR
jgi:hypothetical protein